MKGGREGGRERDKKGGRDAGGDTYGVWRAWLQAERCGLGFTEISPGLGDDDDDVSAWRRAAIIYPAGSRDFPIRSE